MEYTHQFHEMDGEQTEDLRGCACCQCEVPLAWFHADRFTEGRYLCEVCATTNIPSSMDPNARILAQVANHLKSWLTVATPRPVQEE